MKSGKETIHFYNTGRNFRYITVCLLLKGGDLARGISVKSDEDPWNDEIGREHALLNARLAMGGSKHLKPIVNRNAIKVLIAEQCPFVHKGEKNPVLTWQEMATLRLATPFHFSSVQSRRNEYLSIFFSTPIYKY